MFGLTKKLPKKVEKLKDIALFIVFGKHAQKDCKSNLASLNIETLADRREKIGKNFASKVLKHQVLRNIFKFIDN